MSQETHTAQKIQSIITKIHIKRPPYYDESIEPTLINIFYGRNGSGKSTLTRVLRDKEDLKLRSGTSISDFEILVFDKDFIHKNIADDSALPGVFTMDEENVNIKAKINQLNSELNKSCAETKATQKDIDEKKSTIEKKQQKLRDACWNETKELRDTFQNVFKGKRLSKVRLCDDLQNFTPSDKTSGLDKLYNEVFSSDDKTYNLLNVPDLTPLQEFQESSSMQLLRDPIVSSADTPFAKFIAALNATDWVKQGQHYAEHAENKDNLCPYCQRPLSPDIEQQIRNCFDESYQQQINQMKKTYSKYKELENNILSSWEKNRNCNFPGFNLENYDSSFNQVKSLFKLNDNIFQQKLNSPAKTIVIEATWVSIASKFNESINSLNESIKEHNDIIKQKEKKKDECCKQVWQYIAFMMQSKVEDFNKDKESLLKDIASLNKKIQEQKKEQIQKKSTIDQLAHKIVNIDTAMEAINKELRNTGFTGFHLEKAPSDKSSYRIIRHDGTPAYNLSEGERNFIAFLYFYHKCRGRNDAGGTRHDRVIVIDDPISSLDSTALFVTSSLTRELMQICLNNKILDEGTPQYIKQIFVLTHNDTFHSDISRDLIGEYDSVNFYLINKIDNHSSIDLCVRRSSKSDDPANEHNFSPVQSRYTALWHEYKEAASAPVLLRTAQQILIYYFIRISGETYNSFSQKIKNKLAIYEESSEEIDALVKQHLMRTLLRHIDANNDILSDDFYYSDNTSDITPIKKAFKLAFDIMGQTPHYDMMMRVA